MRFIASVLSVAPALGFTSFNSPDLPGNWALPTDAGFGADVGVSGVPDIQVKFQFKPEDASTYVADSEAEISMAKRLAALRADKAKYSFLKKGTDEILAAMNSVPATGTVASSGMESLIEGLRNSPRPRPRRSFLARADPMEMIPAGVTSGLRNEMDKNRPYTLVLHAPEESGSETNRALDALTRVELHAEHALESAKVAEQSRLLNEEIAAIQDIVGHHHSFLQGHTSIKTDARIVLHPVGYARAALKSGVSAIERAEASRQLAAAASDNSLKKNLLAAEIAKIGRIVRGA